jgi:hypothetical protein
MTDPAPRMILDTPMGTNDAGATTIRGYLIRLLAELWDAGECFSGKHPFGNSDWEGEPLVALARAGHVTARFDADGYVEDLDEEAGRRLITAAIQALGAPGERAEPEAEHGEAQT